MLFYGCNVFACNDVVKVCTIDPCDDYALVHCCLLVPLVLEQLMLLVVSMYTHCRF